MSFEDRYTAMSRKQFPISTYFHKDCLWRYTPTPDYIHEVIWHIPQLLDKDFANIFEKSWKLYLELTERNKKNLLKINRHLFEYSFILEQWEPKIFWSVFLWAPFEMKYAAEWNITLMEGSLINILSKDFIKYDNKSKHAFLFNSVEHIKTIFYEFLESI